MNELNQYQTEAMRTCSIDYTSEDRMTNALQLSADHQAMLMHAALGLSSEAGEVAGILQKIYQGHSFDRVHLAKELGDVLWMVAEACEALGMQLSSVAEMNLAKLRARYPHGFDPERSLHRAEGDI